MALLFRSTSLTDAFTAASIFLLGVLLCATGMGLLNQWQHLSARHQELDAGFILGVTVTAAGMVVVGWWFLSLTCAALTALLQRHGKTRAAAVTRKLSPAFMQRLFLAALSVQLISGPAAHAGATPNPDWTPTQHQVTSTPAQPVEINSPVPVPTPHQDAVLSGAKDPALEKPALQAPGSPPVEIQDHSEGSHEIPASASTVDPGWQPMPPVSDPGLLSAPALRTESGTRTDDPGVTVLAGDTLWDIAAHQLGPGASDVEIALLWPRWYEANRTVIGQNPEVLLPGQILQPPPLTQAP